MINELAEKAHNNALSKGFEYSDEKIPTMIALIHSEASELLECDRKDKYSNRTPDALLSMMEQDNDTFNNMFESLVKDSFQDELADIVIRVMDLAAFKGVDLEKHILAKMKYNSLRPHKHGGKKY